MERRALRDRLFGKTHASSMLASQPLDIDAMPSQRNIWIRMCRLFDHDRHAMSRGKGKQSKDPVTPNVAQLERRTVVTALMVLCHLVDASSFVDSEAYFTVSKDAGCKVRSVQTERHNHLLGCSV